MKTTKLHILWFYSKAYVVKLFQRLIDTQTWSDEGSVSERILRNYLLLFACVRRYVPCVHTARVFFLKWKESGGKMRLVLTINKVLIPNFSNNKQHALFIHMYTFCLMLWNYRLPADIRLVVYTEGARTEEGWDFLMEMYRHTMYPSEKSQIKAALAYSPLAHKLEW